MAGIDNTLSGLIGYGSRHKKDFGFASCDRRVGATEGMNVLVKKDLDVP